MFMIKEKYVDCYPKNLEPINRNIDEVIDELNRIARLMKDDNTFYKGRPLYIVLEELADKLSSE